MIDPAFVRDHPDLVRAGLRNRGMDAEADLEALASIEARRRAVIVEVEELKRLQNRSGEEIARAKKEGRDPSDVFAANRERGQMIKTLEAELDIVEYSRRARLLTLPNLPAAHVPVGGSAADNKEVRRVGAPRDFDFEPQAHWDLGPALGIIDFERATKTTGARFAFLMGDGARLSRALINFMLSLHSREHGYTEVEPPFLVNAQTLTGTGNLPKFEADLFKIAGDWDLYLIPTAEVPLTNLYRDEILDGRLLPLKYCAYTPCFRSEAGSYGADVRGLIRQHQFDKVELVKFAHPDRSSRGTREPDARRGGGPRSPRPALPDDHAVHRGHGLRVGHHVRHRGVAAEPEDVPRDLVVQQYRGVPGPPREHQVPPGGEGQGRVRAHVERLGARRRPDADCDHRELPAEGRVDRDPRGAPAVDGRAGGHCGVRALTQGLAGAQRKCKMQNAK